MIIVWLEVRVLPAPPRSLKQTEISPFGVKSPELAGIRARILSLQTVNWTSRALSGPLSLPPKIAFPAGRDLCWWRLGSNAGSVGWKAEHLALPRPFGRQVGETGNAHAVRKPTIDGGFDDVSTEKRLKANAAARLRLGQSLSPSTSAIALCLRSQLFCYFPAICTGGGLP